MKFTPEAMSRRATMRAFIARSVLALRRAEAELNAGNHDDLILSALADAAATTAQARQTIIGEA